MGKGLDSRRPDQRYYNGFRSVDLQGKALHIKPPFA